MLIRKWIIYGMIAGILGVMTYGLAIAGLPLKLGLICGFAFGPLLSVAFAGYYRFFVLHRKTISIQLSLMFGVIAGTIVNMMIVIQSAVGMKVPFEARAGLGLAWDGLNMVQLGLDVSWDIYFSLATLFLGIAMLTHPRFGKIWGILTILIGSALLILNLMTFPNPPADAGLFDAGPVSGIWYLIISIRILFSMNWVDKILSQHP